MTDRPCPGPCNTAHRRNPDQHQPTYGEPVYCRPCADRALDRIQAIPGLAHRLGSGRLNTGTLDSEGRVQVVVAPSLSPAYDTYDQAQRFVHEAANQARTWAGHPTTHTPDIDRDTAAIVRWWTPVMSHPADDRDLAHWQVSGRARPEWWQSAATEFLVAGLLRLHASLVRATGTDRPVTRLPEPCPRCERRGVLQRADGQDLVQCRRCGACWDYEHLPMLTRASLDVARQQMETA